MTVQAGRQMHEARRNPQPPLLDAQALSRSAVARGRARYAARGGDREARAVLAAIAEDTTETTPLPAA